MKGEVKMEQKPIRTFILFDKDGIEHEINEYPDHGVVKGDGYKHPLEHYNYFTSDNIEVFPEDDGSFSSAGESLKLSSC
jgi:hypothetical protein